MTKHHVFALTRWLGCVLLALLVLQAPARAAQQPLFSVEQLDQMLAPIALFPDPLLSQVLMAATYPSEVAEAAEWALANRGLEGDAAVRAVQHRDWDPSVQSLVAFPQVIAMMGDNPQWVRDLGDAFLDDPDGVMDSVQFLRAKARDAGTLTSNEHQVVKIQPAPARSETVVVQTYRPPQQIIVIEPANPQVIFVPIYNPNYIFGTWWNPWAPPLFFPPAPHWGFVHHPITTAIWWGVGIGVTHALWGRVHWRDRSVNVNVNHWNNINVNNRINVNANNRDVRWRHNERNRRDVPYRSDAARERVRNAAADRGAGRPGQRAVDDVRRDQARDALANRVGSENMNRDALRQIDRNQVPGRVSDRQRPAQPAVNRDAVRERAAQVDRSQVQNRAANIDRDQARARAANVDRAQAANRAAGVDRAQVQNRAANIDRSAAHNRVSARPDARQQQAQRINRDNALAGASRPQQTRQQIDRGAASQRIANQPQAAQRLANHPQAAQRAANHPQAVQRAHELRGRQ